jgi:hypothetical protein
MGEALEWLLVSGDDPESNLISAIGRAVSAGVRRAVLREALTLWEWNLSRVSEHFDMGHPSAVLRAIRDLGLDEEYAAHKRAARAAKRGAD